MTTLIADRYELVEVIGAGGMGEVWRGRDSSLGRDVAVKVLPPELALDKERRRRFEREAKAVARLNHPNIVGIHDYGSEDGRPYAVMELLEGTDLRQVLAAAVLPWRRAVTLALQIVQGLEAAHQHGVIHRDLKPTNLFLTTEGTVKLLDFGLARLAEPSAGGGKDDVTLTDRRVVVGTAAYMAPEQVQGRRADARSDLFSFGCVMYEMLSGQRPFRGDSPADVMSSILRDEAEPLPNTVPVALRSVVKKCLRKRPEHRFASAGEVSAALDAIYSTDGAVRQVRDIEDELGDGSPRAWRLPRSPWVIWAGMVAFVPLVLFVGRALVRPAQSHAPQQVVANRIAVAPFENLTGDRELDRLGVLAAEGITQGLADVQPPRAPEFEEGADLVPVAVLRQLGRSGSALTPAMVAEATGARVVVTGAFHREGHELLFSGSIADTRSNTVVGVLTPVSARSDELGSAINQLRDQAFIAVTDYLSPILGAFADRGPPDIEAYREFLSFTRYLDLGDLGKLFELANRLVKDYPSFYRFRVIVAFSFGDVGGVHLIDELEEHRAELSENQLLLLEACRAEREGNSEKVYVLLQSLRLRAPDNLLIGFWTVVRASMTYRPLAVVETFEHFEPILVPRSTNIGLGMMHAAANAYHLLGRYDDELSTVRRWRAIRTDAMMPVMCEGRALVGLGRLGDLASLTTEAQTARLSGGSLGGLDLALGRFLLAHGHREEAAEMLLSGERWYEQRIQEDPGDEGSRGGLADCLRLRGKPAEALAIYQRLLAGMPDEPELWLNIGRCAAMLGDRKTAAEMDDRLEDIVDTGIELARHTVYRAEIAAVLGDRDEAMRLLREGLASGPNEWQDMLWLHNRLLLSLHGDPEFEEIILPKS